MSVRLGSLAIHLQRGTGSIEHIHAMLLPAVSYLRQVTLLWTQERFIWSHLEDIKGYTIRDQLCSSFLNTILLCYLVSCRRIMFSIPAAVSWIRRQNRTALSLITQPWHGDKIAHCFCCRSGSCGALQGKAVPLQSDWLFEKFNYVLKWTVRACGQSGF